MESLGSPANDVARYGLAWFASLERLELWSTQSGDARFRFGFAWAQGLDEHEPLTASESITYSNWGASQ